jgi:hypothetical protein
MFLPHVALFHESVLVYVKYGLWLGAGWLAGCALADWALAGWLAGWLDPPYS